MLGKGGVAAITARSWPRWPADVPIGERIRVAGASGICVRGPAILDADGVPLRVFCVTSD